MSEDADNGKLTPQQELFIQEYLVDFNGTQAAIRAGYSEKTARQQASRLLTNVAIGTAIEAGRKQALELVGLTAERILTEVAAVAFAEVGEPIRPSDKLRALEMAGKHFGLFKDRVEHSGPEGGPIPVDDLAMGRWIALKLESARVAIDRKRGESDDR
jgi:hypothetical protein